MFLYRIGVRLLKMKKTEERLVMKLFVKKRLTSTKIFNKMTNVLYLFS